MKILIVDDKDEDRKLVRYNLEKHGIHEIIEAGDGNEGLSLAKSEKPDLIISDALMPKMDGFQFLRLVKADKMLRSIQFIFYSAVYTGVRDEELALSLGAEAFLVKPLEPEILWQTISDILDKRRNPQNDRFNAELVDKNEEFISKYGQVVTSKLQEKISELQETLKQRIKAEQALKESEARYRCLLESVTDYIYTIEIRDGQPSASSHSPGCTAVTGYSPDEFTVDQSLWLRMVHDEDRPAVQEQAARVLSGLPYPLEHRIVHKNGEIRWVRNTPVLRKDSHGCILAYDGLISDITERRNLENQLLHSQKMEALGTLVGGIAHDFNNILMVIIGYVNIFKSELIRDDRPVNYVDEVLTAADRAVALTRSLLAFGRKQEMAARACNLNFIVNDVKKMLLRLLREDIELQISLCEEELIIMADQQQIEQVLINLAINSRDAIQSRGIISIRTERIEIDRKFTEINGFCEPGSYALLVFSDNGAGMDDQTRQRIFEPFFTTKETGKGTGLGLSMCHGIIRQHNGHIDCRSKHGEGAVFTIYLPLIEAEVKNMQSLASGASPGGTEVILLAEDDLQLRSLYVKILSNQGYEVIEAEDGEDALKKFNDRSEDIRLVIVDCIMPKLNGKEVCREIEKVKPQVKIIFTSGYSADIFGENEFDGRKVQYLAKPVMQGELLQCVRNALDCSS